MGDYQKALCFHCLELFLLNLGLKLIDSLSSLLILLCLCLDFVGKTLDGLPIPVHLLVELLLQAAHQGVHHHVAILLDVELASQLPYLALQTSLSLLSLSNQLLRLLHFAVQIVERLL